MDVLDDLLFPIDFPGPEWVSFPADGFSDPVCGVIYRSSDKVTNGMPLGGIDTGCLDLETSGLLGYCTIFNTHVPRRGPLNLPFLGIGIDGKVWAMCHPDPKDGEGGSQQSAQGRSYNLWRGERLVKETEPITPIPMELDLQDVRFPREIHYWGHYPVADLEFELDVPLSVGLRAWSPFLPGHLIESMIPGIVFEIHLRNRDKASHNITVAVSFPGPTREEAGSEEFDRIEVKAPFTGVRVGGRLASFALGLLGHGARTGGGLGLDGSSWAKIATELPEPRPGEAGAAVATDMTLSPGERRVLRFVLTWSAPTWNAGGYNWAGASHTFTHMYARFYPDPLEVAGLLAEKHDSLLHRVLSWQETVYREIDLPVWLRESLVNVLHLITEDGLWAQAGGDLPKWVSEEDGLFGMNECPRGCPQIECIPCSFYGNQPLVYFFPRLALSTLRGYENYQYDDGAPPWIFGGCTAGTPPIDFANPARGYQFATNGISLSTMIDRYLLCYGDESLIREFYPVVKRSTLHTVSLRRDPSYSLGERIISMPDPDSDESVKPPTEWFEAPKPGWFGMTAHVGGLHLAEILIAQRLAREAGDDEFAEQCESWLELARDAMEKRLWTGSHYLNFLDPKNDKRSDLVFGYQLDGQWIADSHGLPPILPKERIETTLDTIRRFNASASRFGAVNYTDPNGRPAEVGGYGAFSFFPPEALMLAMTYVYNGQRAFGLELARRTWHNIVCRLGYTWDMPNIMRGDMDTGERTFGYDYYQDMMLWSLPAALKGQAFAAPTKPGGFVRRVIDAARPR